MDDEEKTNLVPLIPESDIELENPSICHGKPRSPSRRRIVTACCGLVGYTIFIAALTFGFMTLSSSGFTKSSNSESSGSTQLHWREYHHKSSVSQPADLLMPSQAPLGPAIQYERHPEYAANHHRHTVFLGDPTSEQDEAWINLVRRRMTFTSGILNDI